MEYQKIVLIVISILALLVVYLALTTPKPVLQSTNSSAAEALLLRGVASEKGETRYAYAYSEISDGYKTDYVVEKNGENGSVEVRNLLSVKKAYFLQNETILCIRYPMDKNESCASVQGKADLENYMNSLSSKFLNDANIERNKNDMRYLIDNRYVIMNPVIATKTVNGKQCEEISYRIDFTNVSLSDAARFGIGSKAPKIFNWKMCIDNKTGEVQTKYFDYMLSGKVETYEYALASFRRDGINIEAPTELAEDITPILYAERGQYKNLAACYINNENEGRNNCINALAITLKRADICELTGQLKDSCLVGLVPITKDATICDRIMTPTYKDDCYIELAGAYKNESYCGKLQNASKLEFCNNVTIVTPPIPIPEPVPPETNTNRTVNSTRQDFINHLINQVDKENDSSTPLPPPAPVAPE